MILAGYSQMVRMNDEEVNSFLERPYLAAFSTVDPRGKPHVTSVWYLFTKGYFFHVIEKKSIKWRNLMHGSSIGICVHNNNDERTLSAYGNPRLLQPTDEDFNSLHWKLSRRYFGIEKDKKYFEAANERINKTKVIEESYLDTLENNRSKPRVPFGSLVELGIIKPGTNIFDQKKKINAKIMADGSIKHSTGEGSIHKVAAKILGTESCNGWTYWHCNINGSVKPIDNLRQKFLSKNI